MHLEKTLCEHFCFQMTILIPGTIGKCSVEREHPFLAEIFYEQLFHPVHFTACRICQSSSEDKIVLPSVTGLLSIPRQLLIFEVQKVSVNCTRQNSTCLYLSGSLHIHFSYQNILFFLGEIFLLCDQSFQCLAIVAFQIQLVYFVSGDVLEL